MIKEIDFSITVVDKENKEYEVNFIKEKDTGNVGVDISNTEGLISSFTFDEKEFKKVLNYINGL